MTRQDFFGELADIVFALTPSASDANDDVTLEDVEETRQKFVAVLDRSAMRVSMDSEFTVEDEADLELQQELDEADRG